MPSRAATTVLMVQRRPQGCDMAVMYNGAVRGFLFLPFRPLNASASSTACRRAHVTFFARQTSN
jgi:hypothetical protein